MFPRLEILNGYFCIYNFYLGAVLFAFLYVLTVLFVFASHHVLDEAERSLHDALCVLSQTVNDSRVVLGGGWPEMIMSKEVDELARKTPGKKSHAIEAFSRALQAIPTIIADNAGLDSADLIAQLRAEHHKEGCNAGIDVITGSVSAEIEINLRRLIPQVV